MGAMGLVVGALTHRNGLTQFRETREELLVKTCGLALEPGIVKVGQRTDAPQAGVQAAYLNTRRFP